MIAIKITLQTPTVPLVPSQTQSMLEGWKLPGHSLVHSASVITVIWCSLQCSGKSASTYQHIEVIDDLSMFSKFVNLNRIVCTAKCQSVKVGSYM